VPWAQAEQEQQTSSSTLQGHTAGRARATAGCPGEFHFESEFDLIYSRWIFFFDGRNASSRKRFFVPGEFSSSTEETLLRESLSSFQANFLPRRKKRFFAKVFLCSRRTSFLDGRNASSRKRFFVPGELPSSTEETLLCESISSFQTNFLPRRKKRFFAEAFLRSRRTSFLDRRNAFLQKRFFVPGGLFSSTEEMLLRENVSSFQVDFFLRWKKCFFAEAFLSFP